MKTAPKVGETPNEGGQSRILPPPTVPRAVAEAFAALECMADEHRTLFYWRGSWWKWHQSHWVEAEANLVKDKIWEFTADACYVDRKLGEVRWSPNTRRVNDVLEALRGICRMRDENDAPCWLDGRASGSIVACSNGLLDIGSRELKPHTPLYFNFNSVPFEYDGDALCPEFDRFIASLWDAEDESRRTFKQMLGYLVSNRTDLQCVFGLFGSRRAGKGTIARLISALLGGNVAALTQADLGYTFGLEHVISKPLAIISDARTSGKNTQTVVERLLSISGEDAVPVPRKNRSTWNGRLSARIMILSNEIPHLGDASTAVIRRFVMLVFSRTFAGREDRQLEGKLKAELPGILNVALDGLQDLDRTGQFAQSKKAIEMLEDAADLSSPLRVFMREECEKHPEFRVSKNKLYQSYRIWADRSGYTPLAKETFARALYLAGEGTIYKTRSRNGDERDQLFSGIKLSANAYGSAGERATDALRQFRGGLATT